MEPLFLTATEIIEINRDQVRRYGGLAGVRDEGLLLSAPAMPEAGFGDLVIATAEGRADKPAIAAAFREHSRESLE